MWKVPMKQLGMGFLFRRFLRIVHTEFVVIRGCGSKHAGSSLGVPRCI
jgi:hypothetical protein